MANETNERNTVSTDIVEAVSRRSVLTATATLGVAGGVGSLVGARETNTDIELEGAASGWVGVAPGDIEGETNPTLALQEGEEYTVTWINADGMPHNFVIEDGEGANLVESEIISEGSQTVEFTATVEMDEYYCGVHPESMRGDVRLSGDDPSEGGEDLAEYDAEEPAEDDEEAPSEDDHEELEIELPQEYHAHLGGDPHDVETDASGEARFQVNEDGTEAHYEVIVENICNVTQAHIHLGDEGEDGPVVVWLYPEEGMEPERIDGRFSGTLAEGVITEAEFVGEWENTDFEDVVAIFEEKGAYVNVHTEDHPGGELRGQIQPPHE